MIIIKRYCIEDTRDVIDEDKSLVLRWIYMRAELAEFLRESSLRYFA